MTTHFLTRNNTLACGRGTHLPNSTDAASVTCQRCLGTAMWAEASYQARQRARGVVPFSEDVKTALDTMFESVHKVAESAGYCSTYDEIVDQAVVPSWYEIPTRKEAFGVELTYDFRDGIRGKDEDEVFALIAENPRRFLSLTEA